MKTDYINDLKALSDTFNLNVSAQSASIPGHREFEILSCPFRSTASFVYPESGDYGGQGGTFTALLKYYIGNNRYSNDLVFHGLENSDRDIKENICFRFPVFVPAGLKSGKRAIILLHGLNEKHWDKYLPWALKLMEETGSPVIMFPIAFHMNRAPEAWGNPRGMIKVAEERKHFVPEGSETSFLNAALSHRIQFAPHRFFSSGMQTYYDIINLVSEIRTGAYPFLDRNCGFDFFSYSIGASLAEVLVTSSFEGCFDDSRAFLFCGGAVLDTAAPVSKTIIDGAAYVELFRWLGGLFESVSDLSRRFREIFAQGLPEVLNFKSFLFYDRMQSFRESSLRKSAERINGVSLKKDNVFTPDATSKTLNGFSGDIGIKTVSLDFPFDYRHEEPFPADTKIRVDVNEAFEEVFSRAGDFLNKSA